MPFFVIYGPPDRIDYKNATDQDRMRIRLRNNQTLVFKVHGKSRRLICDQPSLELLDDLSREIHKLFQPPSRLYGLDKPTAAHIMVDMQILLPFEVYVTPGRPLVLAVILGDKTFGLTPPSGSPVDSVDFYTV